MESTEIILIASTVVTLLISLLDVIINSLAHTRDRKLQLSLCKGCMNFNYESNESSGEEEMTNNNSLKETM
jgi:hypothetical protein